ncbi:metallophosphoesterase [Nocardia terpenica]|uniref:Phosphohydrolase n=1 Tax=Nocardia terpenica TaxID=455432 RepID=A0A164PSR4_9NOCA|nr:metallophosphoesterase [Nocardia terpenica]KZM76017.1 phosphohydrolase [Nocardia terpenica]MBF6061941.1 metallophosphoesterase [Nocardia terpenica]MBF6106258.1 metallophosphoesterase [Nocardia terpenica]MBF6110361.1 metallophosphoesterase [Nocardia terpenica]MBF6120802.1 metallophosphoesterase [Nocardia terpenica]
MSCCGPNRRRVLGALSLAAALPLLPAVRPGSARAQANSLIATDLEVVTITDTSVVLTWTTLAPDASGAPVPVDAGTEVRLGPADAPLPANPVFAADPERTPYHYAEVTGLEPGRAYRFEAWSDGVRATPAANLVTRMPGTPECTGRFTTATPPPGRLLRTLALSNDVHFGEEVAGLIAAGQPPGVSQEPGLPPYPEVMLAALLDDLRRPDRGADHLIVAGDLTAEATPGQSRGVRAHLDTWGAMNRDWFAARGNHDRPHVGADYAACPPVADADHHDCWGESFLPRGELTEHELGGLRLLGLDTTELDGAGGMIDRPQLDRLREILRADPDRPTLVFGHHPVTFESGVSNLAGPDFVLDRADATELQTLYRSAPGVFLHHSGHTHRNRRTRPDLPLDVEFLEVAAVKEYPGGYTLLRLYEGGYTANFYKTRTPYARRWSTRSRAEYLGLFPEYTLGTTADRNHVVPRDLSGLT